jgi:hypothetical protein
MSAFKIYSSLDHYGQKLGLKSKAVFAAIALVPFLGFIAKLFSKTFDDGFGTIITIISLLLLLMLALSAYLLTKQLKQIGTMNFYKNHITKKLGDLSENWDFNSIQKFALCIHMRDLFFQKNKFGIRAYSLEVIFKNKDSQKFILSSISEEKAEFNLADLLKTLCNTNHIELSYG